MLTEPLLEKPVTYRMMAGEPRPGISETLYFYDGELSSVKGRVDVPKANPHWVRQFLVYGYKFMNPSDAAEYEKTLY